MRKTYTKTGRSCRVTFELPSDVDAQSVVVCGEFNDWDSQMHPMKRRKDGSFSTTLSLKPGASYRFRYLLDGERWENDWVADRYVANEYGTQDSLVIL